MHAIKSYTIRFTEVVWGIIMLGPLKNSLLRFLTSNKDNRVIPFFKLTFHMKKILKYCWKKEQTSGIHPQLQVVQLAHILQWGDWLLQSTEMKRGVNRIYLTTLSKLLKRILKLFEVLLYLAPSSWLQNFKKK